MPKRTSRITGPTYGTRARHHHCMSSFGRPETLAYNLIEVKGLRGVHFCSYRAQCYYGHQTWTVKSRLAGQSAQGTDRWSPPLWIEVASFLLQVQEKLVLEGLGDLGPLDGIWRRQPSADLLEALFLQGVHCKAKVTIAILLLWYSGWDDYKHVFLKTSPWNNLHKWHYAAFTMPLLLYDPLFLLQFVKQQRSRLIWHF